MNPKILMVALFLSGCQTGSGQVTASEREIAGLMQERLSYAPRIAWIKYQNGQPISDSAREVVLLQNLEAAGKPLGLDPRRVREFFTAQMAAFQQVQKDEIQAWKSGRPAPSWPPMDLQTEIRPAIEKLNARLLVLLATTPVGPSETLAGYCEKILREAGFSAAAVRLALAPLAANKPGKAPGMP